MGAHSFKFPDRQFTVPASGEVASFETHAAFTATHIRPTINVALVSRYSATSRARTAMWGRAGSEPAHPGKAQTADGSWWEFAGTLLAPWMLGAANNGIADDADVIGDVWDACVALGVPMLLDGGTYGIGTQIVKTTGIHILVEQPTEWLQLGPNKLLRVGHRDVLLVDGHMLASDALTNSITLTLASGHGANFEIGEECVLISEATAVGSGHTAKTGQPVCITNIVGDVISITSQPLWFDFLTSDDAQLCKVDWVDGMKISGQGKLTLTGAAFEPQAIATGTVATGSASTTVVGTNTLFLTELDGISQVRVVDTDEWLVVDSITNDTAFEVEDASGFNEASSTMEIYPFIQDFDMFRFTQCRDMHLQSLEIRGFHNVGITVEGCLRPHIRMDCFDGSSNSFTTVARGFAQTINGFSYGVALGCGAYHFDLVVNGTRVRHAVTTAQVGAAQEGVEYGLPCGVWHDSTIVDARGASADCHSLGYNVVFENLDIIGGMYVGVQRRSVRTVTRNVRVRDTIGAALWLVESAIDAEVDGISSYNTNIASDGVAPTDWRLQPALRVDCTRSTIRARTIENCGGPAYTLGPNSVGKHVFIFDKIKYSNILQPSGFKTAIRVDDADAGDELWIDGGIIEGDGVNMTYGIYTNSATLVGEVRGMGPSNITGWTIRPWTFAGLSLPWRQPENTHKEAVTLGVDANLDLNAVTSRKLYLSGNATLDTVSPGPDGWVYTLWGSAGSPVTISHATANGFRNAGAASRVLDGNYKNSTYIQEGGILIEIARSDTA